MGLVGTDLEGGGMAEKAELDTYGQVKGGGVGDLGGASGWGTVAPNKIRYED